MFPRFPCLRHITSGSLWHCAASLLWKEQKCWKGMLMHASPTHVFLPCFGGDTYLQLTPPCLVLGMVPTCVRKDGLALIPGRGMWVADHLVSLSDRIDPKIVPAKSKITQLITFHKMNWLKHMCVYRHYSSLYIMKQNVKHSLANLQIMYACH